MSKIRNKKTHCLNCNYSFKESENYCPNCSQENHDLKIPFKHFIEEILESLFHFDNKVWLSIKTLFFYPGKITKDFLEGKRVSFVPPMRLYVFFSFLFFFFLNLSTRVDENKKHEKIIDVLKKEAVKDSVDLTGLDSLEIMIEKDSNMSKSERNVANKLKKLTTLNRQEIQEMNQQIYKYMSFALFILLPIFALLMKLFFHRSNKFYYEHFIASIHYHVILFIILLLFLIVKALHLPSYIYYILIFGAFVYFANCLKVVYDNSWPKSILKALLIFIIYGVILGLTGITCALYVGYNYFQ